MPTYEYECESCGHCFERFQRMSEPPIKRCPKCRKKVRRLLGTGAGVIFKGSGFYETDYRRKIPKDAAKNESSATPTSTPTPTPAPASKEPASPKKADGNQGGSRP